MFASRTVGTGTEMLDLLLKQMKDELPDLSSVSRMHKKKKKLEYSIKTNAINALISINKAIMEDHAQLSEYQQYANIFSKATLYIRRWVKVTNRPFSFPLFKAVDSKVRMKQVYNDAKQTAKDAFPNIDFSAYERLMDKLINEVELLALMRENKNDLTPYLQDLFARFQKAREVYELDEVEHAGTFADDFDQLYLDAELITPQQYALINRSSSFDLAGDPFDDEPEESNPAPAKGWFRWVMDKVISVFHCIIQPFRLLFGKSNAPAVPLETTPRPPHRDSFNHDWTAATDADFLPKRPSRSRLGSRAASRSRTASRSRSEVESSITTPSTAYVPSAYRRSSSRRSLASQSAASEEQTPSAHDPNASFFGVKH